MPENYKVKYKKGDFEVEIESTDKNFADPKLKELVQNLSTVKQKGDEKKPASTFEKKIIADPSETEEEPTTDIDIPTIANAITETDNYDKVEKNIIKKR